MTTKQELIEAVKAAYVAVAVAEAAVEAFDDLPENNVFESLSQAEDAVHDALLDRASADCEGSHNCGLDKYERKFIVDGKTYIGTLKVEYNRHDKTFYYVDEHKFTYALAE